MLALASATQRHLRGTPWLVTTDLLSELYGAGPPAQDAGYRAASAPPDIASRRGLVDMSHHGPGAPGGFVRRTNAMKAVKIAVFSKRYPRKLRPSIAA